ncbi:MAG: hypothetical protein ACE14V_07390 [bacterium]
MRNRPGSSQVIILGVIIILFVSVNISIAVQPTITFLGSGTVLIGDTRVLIASGGTAPYTWSIQTVSGAPAVLSSITGETVSFLATVDPGTCSVVVTDSLGAANTTENISVVPSPSPIKSFWLHGTYVASQSDANSIIAAATTHQVRDILLIVKGGSGTFGTTRLDWLTNAAKTLQTNVRVHPWVICFSDSAATTLGIYSTVGGSWINPMDPRYRQYLMDSCIIPLARDHQDINGIHLDCYRYPGNAYKYDQGASLVSFCAEIATTVRKYNPAIPISIAPMPETSGNEYYYGQSYYKLSTAGCRFFGVMSYTGNYEASAAWVGRVTRYVRNTSARTCGVYAGEQFTYDSPVNGSYYMASTEIAAETKYAVDSGAQGVAAFRWPIQSYQWTAWDMVGTTAPLTIDVFSAITIAVDSSIAISASGGWKPYTQWTTSNWNIGTVSTYFSDDSIKFYAVNTGTCTISLRDSAPGPHTATSVTITIIPKPAKISYLNSYGEFTASDDTGYWYYEKYGDGTAAGVLDVDTATTGYAIFTQIPGQKAKLSQVFAVPSTGWYTANAKVWTTIDDPTQHQKVYLYLQELDTTNAVAACGNQVIYGGTGYFPGAGLVNPVNEELSISYYANNTNLVVQLVSINPSYSSETGNLIVDYLRVVADAPIPVSVVSTLTNTGFDEGTTGWMLERYGDAVVAGIWTGAYSNLILSQDSGMKGKASQVCSIDTGKPVYGSVWVYSDASTSSQSQKVYLYVYDYTNGYGQIMASGNAILQSGRWNPNQWHQIQFVYIPASEYNAVQVVGINAGNPWEALYFDTLELKQG